MWGDYELLQFYPRNWGVGCIGSGQSLVVYLLVWQYWMWFSFILLINAYFLFLFRTLSFRRADIRGRRGSGDKRRSAWPEIFTCFFPLLWCFNILILSLNFLKTIEVNGGCVALTVQIVGFQWGWRYGYGETGYIKLLLAPVKVGYGSAIRPGGGVATHNEILEEAYFIRRCLYKASSINSYLEDTISVPMHPYSFSLEVQGAEVSGVIKQTLRGKRVGYVYDPLRLLRTGGTFVLPTRTTVRLLSTAEDVIHSWAVPALGLKLDCVPGRLFVSFVNIIREGAYYGQCSELCGWNHYNMPIVLYALPFEHFISWWEIELHGALLKAVTDTGRPYNLLNIKYK